MITLVIWHWLWGFWLKYCCIDIIWIYTEIIILWFKNWTILLKVWYGLQPLYNFMLNLVHLGMCFVNHRTQLLIILSIRHTGREGVHDDCFQTIWGWHLILSSLIDYYIPKENFLLFNFSSFLKLTLFPEQKTQQPNIFLFI